MTGACHAWRGDLAARALGRLEAQRGLAVDAHLDGCGRCRAELEDLRATTDVLGHADPDSLSPSPLRPDPELGERVVAEVTTGLRAARRRRRARVGAAAVAAVAVVAVAAVAGVALDDDDGASSLRVALDGPVDATGEAGLVARAWGTEVTLDAVGLEDGDVYWVWVSDDAGDRVAAGTITGTGSSTTAVLASAVPFDDADRIWLTDEDDAVILDGHR